MIIRYSRSLHDRARGVSRLQGQTTGWPRGRLPTPHVGLADDLIIQSVQPQLTFQRERGTDLTLFSPRAAGMAHHVGPQAVSRQWTSMCNDLIHRVCTLLPDSFVGVGKLPQSPGVSPRNCVPELNRIVRELGHWTWRTQVTSSSLMREDRLPMRSLVS